MDSDNSDVIFDEEERRHYERIIKSFKCYQYLFHSNLIKYNWNPNLICFSYYATERIAKSLAFYHQLPEKQKNYLNDFEDKIKHLLRCIDHNQEVINSILEDADDMFETSKVHSVNSFIFNKLLKCATKKHHFSQNKEIQLNEDNYYLRADVDRVVTTLKQIRRDWSSDGKHERDQCYLPIINDLKNLFKNETKWAFFFKLISKTSSLFTFYSNKRPEMISVLVPGAGLGRLAFEIASLGFKCQGNELSLHMLITSNFILNK